MPSKTMDEYEKEMQTESARIILNSTDPLFVEAFPEMKVPLSVPARAVKPLDLQYADELYNEVLKPIPVILPGLLPAGLAVLAGAPKRGKSFFVLDLAAAVANGTDFLGLPAKQGDALYLSLESGKHREQKRLHLLLPAPPMHHLQITYRSSTLDRDLIPQLQLWYESVEDPTLIIIDTVGKVKGSGRRGENAYEADTRIYGELQQYAMEREIAILLLHHLNKSKGFTGENYFERISGSMGLTGACDTIMMLTGEEGDEEGTLRVTGRDIPYCEMVLAFRDCHWSLRSTNSAAYQQEQEYVRSPVVRGVIRLMQDRERWEGTPRELLEEIMGLMPLMEGTDVIRMSAEINRQQKKFHDDNQILVNNKKDHKGRRFILSKVMKNEF